MRVFCQIPPCPGLFHLPARAATSRVFDVQFADSSGGHVTRWFKLRKNCKVQGVLRSVARYLNREDSNHSFGAA